MKQIFTYILSILCTLLAVADSTTVNKGPCFKDDGSFCFTAFGQELLYADALQLMDENWQRIGGPLQYSFADAPGGRISRGTSSSANVSKTIISGPEWTTFNWNVDFMPTANGEYTEITICIPQVFIDQTTPGPKQIGQTAPDRPITIQTTIGDLVIDQGNSASPWILEDMRNENWAQNFRLRNSPEYSKNGSHSNIQLNIKLLPSSSSTYAILPLPVNRSIKDDQSADKKDGWFNQGAQKDFRLLPTGKYVSRGIPFEFTEQAIILKGDVLPDLPATSPEILLPDDFKVRRLDFIHTCGWCEAAGKAAFEYQVTYGDGTQTTIPVICNMQINDWTGEGATEPLNARIAWEASNNGNQIRAYHMMWDNPQPENPIVSIKVISLNNKVIPVVLAITASRDGQFKPYQFKKLTDIFNYRENKTIDISKWYPCPLSWNGKIHKNSAIDVSFLNHCPAGKYGFIQITPDGHFCFEQRPNNTVRFWGNAVGLWGNFPEKADADGIARNLASQGVNLLRMHLYTAYENSMLLDNGELNPENLDKFEYFIAALKRNGIYIYMDWKDGYNDFNRYMPDLQLPANIDSSNISKFMSLIDPRFIEFDKSWAKKLFTHVNPYTGLPLNNEPAVVAFEITNENSVSTFVVDLNNFPEPWKSEVAQLWNDWQLKNKITDPQPLPKNFYNTRFGAEIQRNFLEKMKKFLREEIGIKVPICGGNWMECSNSELWTWQNMDITADHIYASHPNLAGQPFTYNGNPIITADSCLLPVAKNFCTAKLAGKPCYLNEWNFCYPADGRCEGLPYMTAYGSLQDCDASGFFACTGSFDGGLWKRFHDWPGILVHSQMTDPSTWGLTQACAIAWRRGDIKPANRTITFEYTLEDLLNKEYKVNQMPFLVGMVKVENKIVDAIDNQDAWYMNINSNLSRPELYQEALKQLNIPACSEAVVVSDTGEIRRFTDQGLLIVDTPRTKLVTGALLSLGDGMRNLSDLTIKSSTPWGTITVTSLEDEPIASSNRLLICAVGNARNSDAKIEPPIIYSMGTKDVIAEPVYAVITLPATNGHKYHAYALDTMTGQRRNAIEITSNSYGQEVISLDENTKTIYIEIVKDK